MSRNPYPSDVSDEAWALVAPYLTLMTEAAPQRVHAGDLSWGALGGAHGVGLALPAARPAAVGGGVAAGAPLAGGRLLYGRLRAPHARQDYAALVQVLHTL